MSQKTSESDDGVFCKDQSESSSLDKNGGSRNQGIVLKKGPWTSAEDAILIAYVKKHGEGNWNAVQKHSGLYRCGKSCRLRWANHLRPDLKKGAFTQEEEQLIVELHAKMGNKWARMAAHLPGRTDNEIKNYWNTRIKRRQRAGLPLYPPEVSFQALHAGQSQNINGINDGDKTHHGLMQDDSYEIPDVIFDSLKGKQAVFPYELGDITANGMLIKGFDYSQYCSFMPPMLHRQKRLRESSVLFPGGYDTGRVKNEFPSLDQFHNEVQSLGGFFPLDPNASVKHSESFELNDNLSASKPIIGAVKLELPSLQYPETDLGSWGTSSSPQSLLETVDAYIQSPPPTGTVDSDCPASPCNSGLLDALIHEPKTWSNTKNLQSSDKSSNSSSVTPGDVAYSSMVNVGATEWEDYGDPLSPLGHSATSFFSKFTPLSASGSSVDEQAPIDTLIGSKVKSESGDQGWTPDRGNESATLYEVHQADAFIAADWLDQDTAYAKYPSDTSDAIATLLGDDLGSEYKRVLVGTSTSSNSNHQGLGIGSCAWNNMPPVCQISELP